MKSLVTGGLGFIGSHLVEALLRQNHEVVVLDSLERRVHGPDPHPVIPPGVHWIRGSVEDGAAWRSALADVEVVFHQAAYQDYMPDYSTFFRVNVAGTALLFEILRTVPHRVGKIVIASSQAVYGEGQYACAEHHAQAPSARTQAQLMVRDWEVHCPHCGKAMSPQPLEESSTSPYNAYALSKYGQETVALSLGRQLGVPTVALRYSITQGARQSPFNAYSGVCRIFTQRLLAGLAPIVFEDGGQRRDYVHVSDVVAANLLVANDARAAGQAFNVGGGAAITVLEYARELGAVLGVPLAPDVPGKFRVGDNRHSVSSIAKLQALGWAPRHTLRRILADYAAWYRSGNFSDYSAAAQSAMEHAGVLQQTAAQQPGGIGSGDSL